MIIKPLQKPWKIKIPILLLQIFIRNYVLRLIIVTKHQHPLIGKDEIVLNASGHFNNNIVGQAGKMKYITIVIVTAIVIVIIIMNITM